MSLVGLIRKRDAGSRANANPAKVANDAAPEREALAGLAELALAKPAEVVAEAPRRHWQVLFPNRPAMEVLFTPDATRAEVAALYRGARVEPLAEPAWRTTTRAEADELRELVASIFAEATEAERAEVLRAALAGPDAALTSFRLLATDAMERKRHEAQFGGANG